MKNLIIDGANHQNLENFDVSKINTIITDFTNQNLPCGFLQAYGDSYNVTVTALNDGCFTWVFSRDGRVVSM